MVLVRISLKQMNSYATRFETAIATTTINRRHVKTGIVSSTTETEGSEARTYDDL